ncbi:glycogen debranching N-terminal domain-containing protein [Kitasatospora aureofaciens]|uniref:amylo-alpha-1,6-glucosidase n=1 Tax=Kitasatospora aureofaciens TaxID=1894 RepID=UPI0033D0F955
MEATVKTRHENEETMSATELQPFLHDARLSVATPSSCVARPDGRIAEGADGFYHGDRRVLSRLEVGAPGVPNAPVATADGADGHTAFVTVLRGLAESTADPATTLERRRELHPGRLVERYTVRNAGARTARLRLEVRAESDFAAMDTVKAGRTGAPAVPEAEPDGLRWSLGPLTAVLTLTPAPDHLDPATGTLRYDLELAPGQSWQAALECTADHRDGDLFPAAHATPWTEPRITGRDHALARWTARSHQDLRGLLLTDPLRPADTFLAAGAPWFLTLFGRDSLWAARMLLPLGTDLAAGTLRTLARRQGRAVDPATEEQPGKILHEVRRAEQHLDTGSHLPPSYYGTADATPLWLVLLHDAWRWGLPADQVEELLPNAYAHEAAVRTADLLEAFGRPGAAHWRRWARDLRQRFRDRFWTEDADGRYPVVALDRDKRPVDSIASNLGHLLGTGLLDETESALVAGRLTAPGMDSGFGLRTLDAATAGFNPLGYHTGSVWPHDTAVAVHGLARAGLHDAAAPLAAGLVRAAAAFDHRLPELFAGHPRDRPPAAPRPGRPRPPSSSSRHCWGWRRTLPTAVCGCATGSRPDTSRCGSTG